MNHTTWACIVAIVCFTGCSSDDSAPSAKSASDGNSSSDTSDFEPVEPIATLKIESPGDDPTIKNADMPDQRGQQIREHSFKILSKGGFHFAKSLPTLGHRGDVPGKLRPVREIALRLMALDALFTWVNSPESSISSQQLNNYLKRSDLRSQLTKDELEILNLSREEAHELHNNSIGWYLENMWALAWVLGFDPPPNPMSGQVPNEISGAVLLEFLPGLDASIDDLLKKARPRKEAEVLELEDVFYCAHNAVRSAQTGSTTSVPKDFHPIRDGGAIHERRHSLTWAISPDVEWDETDLST